MVIHIIVDKVDNKYFLLVDNSNDMRDMQLYLQAQHIVNCSGVGAYISVVTDIRVIKTQYFLKLDNIGLSFVSHNFKPIYIREIYTKLNYRIKNVSQELLIRAIRIKGIQTEKLNSVNVFDVTGGLAKDAYLIAHYGYNVTVIEQNPVLIVILYYALEHKLLPINLKIVYANSINFLVNYANNNNFSNELPHIIYLDPMFEHKKSAKSNKEMQLIQLLVDYNHIDAIELFKLSLKNAGVKVVLKRDNNQQSFIQVPLPSYVKQGSSVRYEGYLV